MTDKIQTLRETVTAFRNGEFDKSKVNNIQKIHNFWYDWFCKDSSLANKGYTLLQKLNQIADSKKIDADKTYVWFKNNCPCDGSLYDDFRISDIESGDVIYCVIPKSGYASDHGQQRTWL